MEYKINREALREALDSNEFSINTFEIYKQAAAILLEITAEDYVPSEGMINAARDRKNTFDLYPDVFKAMIKELVE